MVVRRRPPRHASKGRGSSCTAILHKHPPNLETTHCWLISLSSTHLGPKATHAPLCAPSKNNTLSSQAQPNLPPAHAKLPCTSPILTSRSPVQPSSQKSHKPCDLSPRPEPAPQTPEPAPHPAPTCSLNAASSSSDSSLRKDMWWRNEWGRDGITLPPAAAAPACSARCVSTSTTCWKEGRCSGEASQHSSATSHSCSSTNAECRRVCKGARACPLCVCVQVCAEGEPAQEHKQGQAGVWAGRWVGRAHMQPET